MDEEMLDILGIEGILGFFGPPPYTEEGFLEWCRENDIASSDDLSNFLMENEVWPCGMCGKVLVHYESYDSVFLAEHGEVCGECAMKYLIGLGIRPENLTWD